MKIGNYNSCSFLILAGKKGCSNFHVFGQDVDLIKLASFPLIYFTLLKLMQINVTINSLVKMAKKLKKSGKISTHPIDKKSRQKNPILKLFAYQ
jgi:hypothetical protein